MDTHRYTDSHCNIYQHPYTDTHLHTQPDPNGKRYRNAKYNTYRQRYAHCYGYPDPDPHAIAHGYRKIECNPAPIQHTAARQRNLLYSRQRDGKRQRMPPYHMYHRHDLLHRRYRQCREYRRRRKYVRFQ